MVVTCKTSNVLDALKANLGEHSKIVAEARIGFIAKARAALEEKLAAIKSGNVVDLTMHLHPPVDHSNEYRTAIRMMEMHTGDTVQLTQHDVRTLIEDQWDWRSTFLLANSMCSGTAAATMASE